jgi:hypothetical protein
MKFFAKRLISWNEPILFPARTRDRRGWMRRGMFGLVVFALMMAGFFADRNWGRAPKFSLVGALGTSASIGLFLVVVLDAPSLNRTITITEDAVDAFGNAGTVSSVASWPLKKIRAVQLFAPGDLGRSFGAMEIWTDRGLEGRLGVPAKMQAARIAQVFHDQGIFVRLAGWEPKADVPEAPTGPPQLAPEDLPIVSARVEPLPEGEAGRIMSPGHFGAATAMALLPFAVPVLAGLGLIGYTVVRLTLLGKSPSIDDAAMGLGGLALIVAGGWFGLRMSNLAPSLYLRGVARSVIGMRPEAVIDPRDPEAVFIDVIPRENWKKVQVNDAADTGFLRIDPKTRSILFEGDRERWRIPAASLVSVEVESYRPPGSAEGETLDLRYVAVIRARVGDGVWEAPVIPCHVEWRPRTGQRREELATEVRENIRTLRPAGTLGSAV